MLLDWHILRGSAVSRLAALALGLAALAVTSRTDGCACSQPLTSPRASLVWDGASYVVAWGSPNGGAVDVYVHRFELSGGEAPAEISALDEPERVIRVDQLSGPPELAAGPGGFLLLVHREQGDVLAVSLDGEGRGRGEPRTVAREVNALCAAPGWMGSHFAAAWLGKDPGGSHVLELALLDRSGTVVRSSQFQVRPGGSCAVAVANRRVGVVYSSSAGDQMAILEGGGELVTLDVEGLSHDAAVQRLIATQDGWALLLRTDHSLKLAELDARGRVVRAYDVDAAIDGATADLGENPGGLFLAWTDQRQFHLAGIDREGSIRSKWHGRGGRTLSAARALGRDDQCAAAWTSLGGLVVHLAVAGQCPAP